MHAARCRPAHAHALPNSRPFTCRQIATRPIASCPARKDRCHAHSFVDHRKIGMTDAAMIHCDFDFVGPKGLGVEYIRFQGAPARCAARQRCET